jgi:MscS family membrane protein
MSSLPVLTPDWFKDTFLGIEVEQYIGIVVLVAIGLAAQVVVITALAVYMRQRTEAADHDFWAMERRRLNRPLLVMLVAVAFLVGFPTLDFDPDVEDVVVQIASLLGAVAVVFVAYRAIDILTDVLARRAEKTENKLDDQLIPLLNTILKIFVTVVGVLFVLQNLDVNIASLIAGLGIGGLAVALAAQDTIKNLLGGVTIFADKPFQMGDWVVVDDIEGTVEHVGFRSTRVRTFANSLVTVPNARLVDTGVDNMGLRRWRRYRTVLGIGYHTRPDQIQAFVEGIRATIRSTTNMRSDFYLVEFTGFGAAALEILVYCFIDAPDWNTEMRTRHVLNLNIMRLAADLEVDFAFPTQTIHIAEMPGQPQDLPAARERDELRRLIEGYAPDGDRGQRSDAPISAGFDNG